MWSHHEVLSSKNSLQTDLNFLCSPTGLGKVQFIICWKLFNWLSFPLCYSRPVGFWKEIILKFPWIWERATFYWAEYNIFFTTPIAFINDKCCNVLRHRRDFRAIFVCVVPSDCQKNTDSRAPPQIYWIKTSGLRARSHLSFRIIALGYGWAFDPVLYS